MIMSCFVVERRLHSGSPRADYPHKALSAIIYIYIYIYYVTYTYVYIYIYIYIYIDTYYMYQSSGVRRAPPCAESPLQEGPRAAATAAPGRRGGALHIYIYIYIYTCYTYRALAAIGYISLSLSPFYIYIYIEREREGPRCDQIHVSLSLSLSLSLSYIYIYIYIYYYSITYYIILCDGMWCCIALSPGYWLLRPRKGAIIINTFWDL